MTVFAVPRIIAVKAGGFETARQVGSAHQH
jgi:hypothetical protein